MYGMSITFETFHFDMLPLKKISIIKRKYLLLFMYSLNCVKNIFLLYIVYITFMIIQNAQYDVKKNTMVL